MRAALAILVCATGCRAIFGLDDPGARPDAPGQPDVDADPLRLCWGTEVEFCLPSPASQKPAQTLSGSIDTSASPLCEASIAGYCVIWASAITVMGLDVSGGRPLVLIGADRIVVEGALDAASHAAKAGPGAGAASCNAFAGVPSDQGGGAGGSFAGPGGAGGGNNRGDTGGGAASIVPTGGLRGGCPGQDGGRAATNRGTAGRGGGAAYLIAGAAIEVKPGARVNASGAAGAGAICTGNCGAAMSGTAGGAGGGGSGGMLILEAPSVTAGGLLIADGGGGGQGSTVSNDGVPGSDPDGTKAALGGGIDGGGNSNGGDGGNGAYAAVRNGLAGGEGMNDTADVGGGGGGGGSGVVRVYGTGAIAGGGAVSPPPDFR